MGSVSAAAAATGAAELPGQEVTATGSSWCFPPGERFYTFERCCLGGGFADCFNDDFRFADCCPDLVGTDPVACLSSPLMEELCCSGAGLPICFSGKFTRRACCYSRWSNSDSDHPAFAALQRAVYEHIELMEVTGFLENRGLFYAYLLQVLGITGSCVEVGVQQGVFSKSFLRAMDELNVHPCRYYMVDVWRQLPAAEHYVDTANVQDAEQRANLQAAADRVADFWQRVSVVQLRSREAARLFGDAELAFVYLDARHDYCAVYEDLELFWPKLRPGGAIAGDDCTKVLPRNISRRGDWKICEDGSTHPGGVYHAVKDFAEQKRLTWRKVHNQFIIVKPPQNLQG